MAMPRIGSPREGIDVFETVRSIADTDTDSSHADPADLASVEVTMDGAALRWGRLDADLLVSGLWRGVFGSRRWMRELARELGSAGGRARSEAKAEAARRNGRKGGRPRKA